MAEQPTKLSPARGERIKMHSAGIKALNGYVWALLTFSTLTSGLAGREHTAACHLYDATGKPKPGQVSNHPRSADYGRRAKANSCYQ